MSPADSIVVGWDIGGAHVKACITRGGEVVDVAQWACPLWLGLDQLDLALQQAQAQWPELSGMVSHAVTMSGEMVDAFTHREDGVQRIADRLTRTFRGKVLLYAGGLGWVAPTDAARCWAQIASANWLATAQHAAAVFGDGMLIDIGSTTADLIMFADGRVSTSSRSDHDRLASGELAYHGVVRTPLCALAQRIAFRGRLVNVMNEWFATTADVYRMTAELDPAHDQQPSADGQGKDRAATQQRLARMIGLDARDAPDDEWLEFARTWRRVQIDQIAVSAAAVMAAKPAVASTATIVAAGCGALLVADLAARLPALAGWPIRSYGFDAARIAATDDGAADARKAAWAQVCAPSVAVASLYPREQR
ncbi:MAG: hydantoinase/oxoprolinase family protein [Rhizobacter sp.]